MRILIEEYQYEMAAVKDILHGIDPLTNIEGKVSIHYVGYYYNSLLKDCVFNVSSMNYNSLKIW